MRLSVVVPARNESSCIGETLIAASDALMRARIDFEIIVVDDGSTDDTAAVVHRIASTPRAVQLVKQELLGYGFAVRTGLASCTGEVIAVMMADGSDSPGDLVKYFRTVEAGYDCAFGSRFIKGSKLTEYPFHKLLLNRIANSFIRLLFGIRFNDMTNAFKCYRREVVDAMQPLISPHFNLTVEMPLKAIVRGYSYGVVPISWTNRKSGVSKLRIKEMGSRYLFIVLYLWLEKTLARGDYYRRTREGKPERTRIANG
jgi:dolichol-phosphate mannosyltransferase